MTQPSIRLSIRDWGRLIGDRHPDYSLVSYGMQPNSGIVRRLVTKRKADGVIFIAETGAQFEHDTDWERGDHLTDMRVARALTTYA